MIKELISIQDAAELSRKSIQTIRRAIKAKKLVFRRQRTPQGFNYMVNKSSLCELFRIKIKDEQDKNKSSNGRVKDKETKFKSVVEGETMTIEVNDFKSFVKTVEGLIAKHSEERQNFMRLVSTMQEKIFILENQLNLLKGAEQKRWYQFWK